MSPKLSDVGFVRSALAGAVFAMLFAAPHVHAGDEVDYSAPYMVVENGELVTKYPAREHEGGDGANAEMPENESGGDESGRPKATWVIAAAALAALLAFLAHARRRSKAGRAENTE